VTDKPQELAQKEKDAVLIVDDDAFMLKVLYRVLQKEYTLYQAGSAEEAVEVLRGRHVKAILCDHILPGQSGLDFLITLKQRNTQIKSVLFSAALETEQFIKAINEGQVFRFVKKPASPADILRAVHEAVRQYDIEMLQQQLMRDQKDIDKQIYSAPYWLYRLRVIAQQSFRCSETFWP
jgi:DNA-binding NtrC family response regulator